MLNSSYIPYDFTLLFMLALIGYSLLFLHPYTLQLGDALWGSQCIAFRLFTNGFHLPFIVFSFIGLNLPLFFLTPLTEMSALVFLLNL